MLQETYIQLLEKYTDDTGLIREFWSEIESHYSDASRHYHTLAHLDNLLHQLIPLKDRIESWETVLFTLFYHDVIYDALRPDNEEQSAELAVKRMKQIQVPVPVIERCKDQILATKTHVKSPDPDTNYFTDADLSVLGQDAEKYKEYSRNVRLEYAYYPSVVYKSGRINVLNRFLSLERIYKTDFFYTQFEESARENLSAEIKGLETVKDQVYLAHSGQWLFTLEADGDYSEFLDSGAKLLDANPDVEKITYYPGFFDNGYYRFYYKNVKLHLEWDGMTGLDLKTEPNPTEHEVQVAQEVYELLKAVRKER